MRVVTLVGQHLAAEKGTDMRPGENGDPEVFDMWTIVMTDRGTGDQHRISFTRDTRDELIRQLTGGIVLAGGELPRLPP